MVARLVRDQEVVGSSPVASTIESPHEKYVDFRYNRGVAQLVARSVRDAEVVGSSPVASTNYEKDTCFWVFLLGIIRKQK